MTMPPAMSVLPAEPLVVVDLEALEGQADLFHKSEEWPFSSNPWQPSRFRNSGHPHVLLHDALPQDNRHKPLLKFPGQQLQGPENALAQNGQAKQLLRAP
jgi:hypothetical protein